MWSARSDGTADSSEGARRSRGGSLRIVRGRFAALCLVTAAYLLGWLDPVVIAALSGLAVALGLLELRSIQAGRSPVLAVAAN
ncbi:MAG: hypothetical protein OEY23_21170 [Acidimicrobiia bacterium]|nr:hypothetical protein [Acidimicrobiia bacterium]